MNPYLGELAALATSLCFSATSTLFTLAGRQVGSMVVNRTRLVLAVLFLTLAHRLLSVPLPIYISVERFFWLGASGIIGLVLGDAFLFQAFLLIGPRLSMLLMALAPVMATLLAWVFLAERLSTAQFAGVLVTLSGIAWVILERNGQSHLSEAGRRSYMIGLLFGLGAAAGQALGLITAKKGLGPDFPALSGTLIRMFAAATTLWVFTLLRNQAGATLKQLIERPQAVKLILGGALAGPFLGVTFSMLAIQHTQVGVASTLMALPPVILLPVGYYIFQEGFGWQAVLGTFLTMAGVGLLFLV